MHVSSCGMDAVADFRQLRRYTSHGRPTGLAPRRVFTEPCYHGNAGALTTRFQPYSSPSAQGFGGSQPCGFERCIFCCTIPVPRDRLLRSPEATSTTAILKVPGLSSPPMAGRPSNHVCTINSTSSRIFFNQPGLTHLGDCRLQCDIRRRSDISVT